MFDLLTNLGAREEPSPLRQECEVALIRIAEVEQELFANFADMEATFELAKLGGWSEIYEAAFRGFASMSEFLADFLDPFELEPEPPAGFDPDGIAALLRSVPLSEREVDAFRTQVGRCWLVPAVAVDAANLIVSLRIFLHPDGSLARAPEIIDRARMGRPGEASFQAAAESAVRAVLRCEPYEMLPASKYELWREIELNFDPMDMLGRG